MAYASRTYAGAGGGAQTFALTNTDGNPIGYIRESDIKVTVGTTVFTNAASGTNTYQFSGTSTLEQPSGGNIVLNASTTAAVTLERTTEIQTATVTYTAGSTLTSSDLNNADNQIRFGLQEFSDIYDPFRTGTGDLADLGGIIGGSETWTSSDAFVATTSAIDTRIDAKTDTALTTDVSGGDGVTIVDNSPGAGQIRIDLDADIATLRNMQSGAATALALLTSTEIAILDGANLSTTELNFVDGVTSAIQTQLDGKQPLATDLTNLSSMQSGASTELATLTAAELEILDGLTASTTELNLLQGVPGTLTTTEIGFLDGVTSAIQTQLDSKQTTNSKLIAIGNLDANDSNIIVGNGTTWVAENGATARTSLGAQAAAADLTNLSSCQTGASAALAVLTESEVQILDGATLSTTELNFVDGVSSAIQGQLDAKQPLDSELTTLAGMTGGTASILANATGLGATLAEINSICENRTAETTISPTDDTKIPTSKAVNDRILTVTNALGGFVAIDNEGSFPNAHPDPSGGAGTVVSIADVGGLVVNASGVATNASTVGGTAVTINGISTAFRGTTMQSGVGMQVQTTSTLNTYDYHKALLKETDLANLSSDIEDFGNRYRVLANLPAANDASNDDGDLVWVTSTAKMMVYSGSPTGSPVGAFEEVQSVGNFFISSLSPAFDGSTIDFTVTNAPANAQQIILSINGVVQQPNAGTGRPTDGFSLNGSTIQLPTGTGPAANTPHFVIVLGSTVNIGTPSDNTVDADILQSGCVTNAKVAANAAIAGTKIDPDFGSQNIDTTGNVSTSKVLIGTTVTNTNDVLIVSDPGDVFMSIRSDAAADNTRQFLDFGTGTADRSSTNQTASIRASIHSQSGGTLKSDLIFQTNSGNSISDKLIIKDTGNVGIGTISPDNTLHLLYSDSQTYNTDIRNAGLQIENNDGTDNTYAQLHLRAGNSDAYLRAIREGSNLTSLAFLTDNGGSTGDAGEAMRIDSNGRVIIGHTTSTGQDRTLQVIGTTSDTSAIEIIRHSANASAPKIDFSKSRNTTKGSNTVVNNGDNLGQITWRGDDGTDITTPAATILAAVDGTPGANDMPGRLDFSTTADGASSTTERMRITSGGQVNIGHTSPTASENGQLNVFTSTSSGKAQFIHSGGTGGIRLAGTGAGSGANLVFSNDYNSGTFSDHWTLTHNGADDSFRFLSGGTGGTERLQISSNGQLVHSYLTNTAAPSYGNGNHEGLMIRSTRDDSGNFLGTIDFAAGRASDANNGGTQFRFFTQPRSTGASALALTLDREQVAHFPSDVKVLNGNVVMGNGRGINFSASSNAGGMTSETLSDFEEGTWTPSLSASGISTNTNVSQGKYQKVGNICHCSFALRMTSHSGGSGQYTVAGLPFTSDTPGGDHIGVSTAGFENFDIGTAEQHIQVIDDNTTAVRLLKAFDQTGWGTFTPDSDCAIYMSFTYPTA